MFKNCQHLCARQTWPAGPSEMPSLSGPGEDCNRALGDTACSALGREFRAIIGKGWTSTVG